MARRVGGANDRDVAAEIVATAWAGIRSYPWQRRQGSVAANLILDMDKPFDISLGQPLPRQDSRSVGLAGEGVEGLPPYNTESPSVGDSSLAPATKSCHQ